MPVNVRPAIPADIPHLMEFERLAPTAAHWSEEQYRLAIDSATDGTERTVLVAEIDGSLMAGHKVKTSTLSQKRRQGRSTPDIHDKIPAQAKLGPGALAGFLVARHVEGEWELENIVVGSEFRGGGIATQLIEGLLARARETGSSAVFLEVRESNAAARKLYEKAGFRETGRRKLYYSHPAEDAVLYCKNLV
jgi:ribosomal-protein-alanine acetyltransferase